jgi:hypothetical protein
MHIAKMHLMAHRQMFMFCLRLQMPAGHPSASRQRHHLMRDAAQQGQMLILHCELCKGSANYWAHDLVLVVGPLHIVHVPPFPCSRCGTCDYVSVNCTLPPASELAKITVRRPVKQVAKWIWRNEQA